MSNNLAAQATMAEGLDYLLIGTASSPSSETASALATRIRFGFLPAHAGGGGKPPTRSGAAVGRLRSRGLPAGTLAQARWGARACRGAGDAVVSIEPRRRGLVGACKNARREWNPARQPEPGTSGGTRSSTALELAWPAADEPRSHRADHRRDHHQRRPERPRRLDAAIHPTGPSAGRHTRIRLDQFVACP
jgi:hypothetical protein